MPWSYASAKDYLLVSYPANDVATKTAAIFTQYMQPLQYRQQITQKQSC